MRWTSIVMICIVLLYSMGCAPQTQEDQSTEPEDMFDDPEIEEPLDPAEEIGAEIEDLESVEDILNTSALDSVDEDLADVDW